MPGRETMTVDDQTAWGTGPGVVGPMTTADAFDDTGMLFGDPNVIMSHDTPVYARFNDPEMLLGDPHGSVEAGLMDSRHGAFTTMQLPGNFVKTVTPSMMWGGKDGKQGRHEFDSVIAS